MHLIETLIIACLFILLKSCFNLKEKANKTTYNNETAKEFINKLEELGYYKYMDNKQHLDSLKDFMIDAFDPTNGLVSIYDEHTGTPLDYRYYFCDGEDVYEQGGVIELINDLKPTFNKINFKCEITNHFEEWDEKNNWLNHKITINGTEYTIFKNFRGYGWGEAPKRVAEILNNELAKQGKNEKIFLVSGGNEGRLIFLTDELYNYIYSIYKNPLCKPLEINEWAKEMKVEPMKLKE